MIIVFRHGLYNSPVPEISFNYALKASMIPFEIRYFKSGTTNQTTIYVRVREQFFSVRRLAATTVKDRSVVSDFLTILVSYD